MQCSLTYGTHDCVWPSLLLACVPTHSCKSSIFFLLLLLTARWYRGLVVTVERYQSEVFFLDHGDTEWVLNNMVQPIDPSLLDVSD